MQKDSVNYAAFIEAVDPEFRAAICDTCVEAAAAGTRSVHAKNASGGAAVATATTGGKLADSSSSESDAAAFEDLLARIRHIVITKRLRVRVSE